MANTSAVSVEARERHDLIAAIERERGSKVITYFLGDRRGAQGQVAEDAVRPMYDHLRKMGSAPKIDLFLYSIGGLTDVPWRIITMIREFAQELAVLVPYKAMSAATMIALGADEVVMGRKGELGPIDPQLNIKRGGEGGTAVQEQIAIEDIMAYIRFLREKAGLTDQSALVGPLGALAGKLDPWILGQVNRAHSHIRTVARKLLTARAKQAPDEQKIQVIVDTLAEKTYQHGHAIGRKEAIEIGLNVMRPSDMLEDLMWRLYQTYEDLCRLREPIEPRSFVPTGQDERVERVIMGCLESVALAHHFAADLRGRNKRQAPPQLSLNLTLNLQFPPAIDAQQFPAAAQQAIQQLVQQFQQQAQGLIQQEMRRQMPITGFEGWTQDGAWRKVDNWPSSEKEGGQTSLPQETAVPRTT
ncbi:MAG: hypothetical protein HY002_15350 [Candidatus Rokubacteria bacterium]|nr:hypothetical protein [Candidatus Rokubacteria bacterium]